MDTELYGLEISIYIVTSLSFLISLVLLLHLLIFQVDKYKEKLEIYMTKLVLWLIFSGLIKNIFGVANFDLTDYLTCSILISFVRFFAMAEQLFSFNIALELLLKSIYINLNTNKYYYKYTLPTIWIISIIIGIMNGIDFYEPGTPCLIRDNAIFSKICTIFFLTIFLVNMLLFLAFFTKSRKYFLKNANTSESIISTKEEVQFYFLIFLTLGLLRAPYYVVIFFNPGIVEFLAVILVNTLSAFLVPLIFAWNFGVLHDYNDWIKRCCNCNSSNSISEV